MREILGVIPSRGGSKGVPGKNIRPLAGKPLIGWTIEAAQQSAHLSRFLVSTDDTAIATIARQFGADVPFMRPAEYAQDHSPDGQVYRHALDWLATHEGYTPDLVVWLRPTTPLRTAVHIDQAIDTLLADSADCLRSVCRVEHHPYWMYITENTRLKPFVAGIDAMRDYPNRQSLPPAYRLNGAVDISRPAQVLASGLLYSGTMAAYIMPPDVSMDIDTEHDFALAERLMRERDYAADNHS